jgi:hypothetical protein
VAGFISEWWPASNRNAGRLQFGIGGRIASEFADDRDKPGHDGWGRSVPGMGRV